MTNPQQWLTTQELADRLQVPLGTVYQWRARGVGPTGVRIGKHTRYSMADVEAWEKQQRQAELDRTASR